MTFVILHEGESAESLINRFRSGVQRSGILREIKRRRYFRSKSQKAREGGTASGAARPASPPILGDSQKRRAFFGLRAPPIFSRTNVRPQSL